MRVEERNSRDLSLAAVLLNLEAESRSMGVLHEEKALPKIHFTWWDN